MASGTASEESDEEFQEIQYERLIQGWRHAKEDQREYTIEKKDQLRTQKKMLKQLKRERDELDKICRLAENYNKHKQSEEKAKQLQELLLVKNEVQNDIEDEKAKSADLDEKIREFTKKIHQKKVEVGGANAGMTFHANVLRQERVLENRLDATLKRFNILLSSNSQLRDEIDTLRTERERFEKLYQKLEKELRYLRTDLLDSIEQSAACYEQRKECNTKAILLQNKAEADKMISDAEMKELERQISHDRKLRDFMKLKGQERQDDEVLISYRKRKAAEANDKRRREKEEHSVEAYESKFKQIQQISGESNLEKLVDRFIEVEDKNFALFNYVNELNNQSELLQEQISDIKKDIQQFEEQGIELEEQRKQILEQMERKRSQALALAKEYEEKSRATKKILDQCRAGIQSLFKKIGCDQGQIDHLLHSYEGVTEENMLRYLGIIEERTNELLVAQATIQAKEQNIPLRERAPNLIGDGPSAPAPHLRIHLPNTEDRRDFDEREEKLSEEDLKPFTRQELQQRAIDHVKNMERKALQEQTRNNELTSTRTTTRERSLPPGASRTSGRSTGKTSSSRGR